jgi:hypothetical protein
VKEIKKNICNFISNNKLLSLFIFVAMFVGLLFATGIIKREGYCIDFVDKPGYCTKIAWVIAGHRLE